jgi:hypothetical protein
VKVSAGKEFPMKSWRIVMIAIVALCLSGVAADAQKSGGSKSGSSSGGSSGGGSSSGGGGGGGGGAGGGSNGPGFSIETEMFTYQAVEANAKVIACNIAQYLYGGTVTSPPAGSNVPCTVANTSGTAPGIILVSADTTLLSNFQLWRADMAMMNTLEQRADQVCLVPAPAQTSTPPPSTQPPSGLESRGLLSTIISNATPATAAATSAGQFMSMLAKNESVMPVLGTVQDPALLNEVGGQLRALGVQVLIPEMYNPNSMGPADFTHSPYMSNLQNLFASYDKCDKAKTSYGANAGAQTGDISNVIASIEAFLKSAFATQGAEIPGENAPQNPGVNTANSSQAPRTVSHFTAVLGADELAREMGFSGNGASGASANWQHLVWLQALESGGSVEKSGGLFGTKVYFGGGAVDTYSVFRLDGQVVCSGNVYNFQTPVKMDDLQKTFQKGLSFDAAKSPLLNSTCGSLPPQQH